MTRDASTPYKLFILAVIAIGIVVALWREPLIDTGIDAISQEGTSFFVRRCNYLTLRSPATVEVGGHQSSAAAAEALTCPSARGGVTASDLQSTVAGG